MFRIRMVFHKTPQRLVFRTGWVFRIVLGVLAAVVLSAGAVTGSLWPAWILAGFAVLGALYEESMSFDRSRGQAEFRTGLVILHKKRVVPLEAVVEVRVSIFGAARFTGLEVVLSDGSGKTIESDRGESSVRKLQRWGAELAEWLGVPFSSVG